MTNQHGSGAEGRITLRYWASLRAAAGVDHDELNAAEPMTLAAITEHARRLHDARRFADVLSTCSVLVDEQPASSYDPSAVVVRPGQTVEFLPPFAGG
ncbi:MAG: MoaD/ThiS family protein [Marmoricola sp.]